MTFRIHALSPEPFSRLHDMDGAELARHHARREIVRACPGTPCRVSLQDAQVGETVILVNWTHQPAASPYQSKHAIFVRQGVEQAFPKPGEVPAFFRHRIMSLRAFDAAGFMLSADLCSGADLEDAIHEMLAGPAVDCVHLHFAKPGCFAALARRADI